MTKKLLFLLLTISTITFAQQNRRIQGKVIDSLGAVKNANIINLKNKYGTATTNTGEFEIIVSLGDSLQISSIQHITKIITVKKSHILNKEITVKLKSKTYILDEFDVKKHNLTGRIDIDAKSVPKRKRDSILRNTMDFSKIDFSEKDLTIDGNNKAMPPIAETDPNKSFEGINLLGFVSLFKKKKPYKPYEKKNNNKKTFPKQLLNELGNDFFFKSLKIPKDNYFHFLEYCKTYQVEKFYKNGQVLEAIQILKEKSVDYLNIINIKK